MGRESQGLVLILRDFDSFGVEMRGENGEYSAEVSSVIRLMPSTASKRN